MRLGFDLDGTLADMQEALARVAKDLFPDVDPASLPRSAAAEGDPTSAQPDDQSKKAAPAARTARQQRALWKEVCSRDNFWETLAEIEPGALGRLSSLGRDRRWEIIFLTSRPETVGDTAQAQSHRWLAAHGFPSPSIFVVHGSRGKIAAALDLDVIVDDRPENCLDVATDSKARPILVWRGDETEIPARARQLGIGVVQSIAECLDILESLERPDQRDQVGVVERLKRLLGLKPHGAQVRELAPPATANDAVKVKT
jgi:hypothetical protein